MIRKLYQLAGKNKRCLQDTRNVFTAKLTSASCLVLYSMSHLFNKTDHRVYPPGDLAIWVFILAELLVFAVFFAAYAFARMNNAELFNIHQATLDRNSAVINTIALLTASYFVVRAVHSIRLGNLKYTEKWLWAAIFMGIVFILIKSNEFAVHFSHGVRLSSNTFYMFYLSLTFFHFMHVILGLIILAAVSFKTRAGNYSADSHDGVETGASYWHMVDLVWLILFPLVYVMQ